jgi:hypothetical protein
MNFGTVNQYDVQRISSTQCSNMTIILDEETMRINDVGVCFIITGTAVQCGAVPSFS